MAFDFPNSPSVGQRVTGVGGIVYVWDGVKWASNIGSVTAQSMGDVGRNLLHNPLFNVAQRGNGPWTTNTFTMDRWSINISSDTVSLTRIGVSDADRATIGDEVAQVCLQNVFTGNAATGALNFVQQSIESARRLSGKTVTVSFWAKAATGTPKVGVNLVQGFGTGGSPSGGVWATAQAITISTTWARYTATYALPSTAGKTFGTNGDDYTGLAFWFSSGATQNANAGNIGVQSSTINIWGVQLEIGSVATPLEKPDPRYDLANCQRFYHIGYGYCSAQGQVVAFPYTTSVLYPVPMRAGPTLVITGNTNTNMTSFSLSSLGSVALITGGTCTASGYCALNFSYTASADL